MKTDLHPQRAPHEMVAFVEFFGSVAVVAVLVFQVLRLALPAVWVAEFGAIMGTFSFLAATGICAWLFERCSGGHREP